MIYYATGATHAPHHAPKEWIEKYNGKFDDGWLSLREKTFARQKEMGIIPENTQLASMPEDIKDWEAARESYRPTYFFLDTEIAGDHLQDIVQKTGPFFSEIGK